MLVSGMGLYAMWVHGATYKQLGIFADRLSLVSAHTDCGEQFCGQLH